MHTILIEVSINTHTQYRDDKGLTRDLKKVVKQ